MSSKSISYFFIALVFLEGCKPAGVISYAYKTDTYVIGKDKRIQSATRLISYGDYLFEFKMKVNFNTETDFDIKGKTETVRSNTVKYDDTIGVYLINNNRQYIEFDTFALSSKIVQRGNLADKPMGVKLGDGKQTINLAPPYMSTPKDTVMNEVPCYYTEVLGDAAHPVSDTVGARFILVKNRHLTSLYKVFGITCMGNEYCIVGMYQYHKWLNEALLDDFAGLRPLTKAERTICESMIQKAGLAPPK
jgi:hypothetical protein